MLFNSIEFAIFLPIVFMLFWLFSYKTKLQNIILVIASYIFYGWWDWRFLSLIFISSILDFSIGLGLQKYQNPFYRKLILLVSIIVNLGFLAFFKYYNFFIDNFAAAFTLFGHSLQVSRLNIVLPVGISFYTFQTMSYSLDVYRRELEATDDIVAFFAYVSFFPQLVAGPIERAKNLLPQFKIVKKFDYNFAVNGMRQILWGLLKKIVIADNCAKFANEIFADYTNLPGSALLLGAFFFAFQIYGDFSGYSDIAIGTARLFGFNLMRNFAYPYFSRDIAEFWRRWHISLSTWFKDYVYIPLGGSRVNLLKQIRNTFVIFLLSGFWHGANWTFIVWGGLNAFYFIPLMLTRNNRKNLGMVADGKFFPSVSELFRMTVTFLLTLVAWIFFRSPDISSAIQYLGKIFSHSLFTIPSNLSLHMAMILVAVALFIVLEWIGRSNQFALEKLPSSKYLRWSIYVILLLFIILLAPTDKYEFIYFQF